MVILLLGKKAVVKPFNDRIAQVQICTHRYTQDSF